MNQQRFVSKLKSYKGSNVFNPYTDTCEFFDKYNAAEIRTKNLIATIDSFLSSGVDSLWIGRDLGHRGGRRTGLALTDEAHLVTAGKKWDVELLQATKGNVFSERTAANIWDFINRIDQNIFMWNVFPFHPYEKGNQLTNRSHTAKERDEGAEILEALVSLLSPERIVAIGNDAFKCASKIFPSKVVLKVRHPSYGGEKDFSRQLCDLYSL
ncbi:MAG TPA: uracil-DNA glycosylase [Mariprofundaceae bacterium]|nr:uracil-DNA glycosylase [Mariprofundaceae bacterium]